ncbi:MAG: 4'-phosphopantetheinyl transferase superfamily protein [Clostridia bacterium]|nr:4'-phosphopantetheinyl transferase superfamily protein [Clostridia bacterium]
MEKIFYADKTTFPTSEVAIKRILSDFFDIQNATILRNEHGKPYLKNGEDIPLYFSVTHTKQRLFIAFCDENVGIDAEPFQREVPHYPTIVRRFILEEQQEIRDIHDFLLHWAVKESVVKWLGSSIAHDLKEIAYVNGQVHYGVFDLHVYITIQEFEGSLVCICSEKDFNNAEWIAVR